MHNPSADVTTTLTRIRDYIRWGASQFAASGIALGQGTVTPLDEAAALVLFALHQPYTLDDPYLDAVLTATERKAVVELLQQRVRLKIPSAYLTREALFAGLSFYVDERVLVPRSPIAELIEARFDPWIEETQVRQILDLCCGSACIAIACACAFPDARVDAVELSEPACQVAEININRHDLVGQVELYRSDLFAAVPDNDYDIIVSNPPYVSLAEWASLPAEFHAEPEIALKGGDTGLDLVLRILIEAGRYLSEHGILVVEVGSSAETLQQLLPAVPFFWLEFERGGDGVFLLTAAQVKHYHSLFTHVL